jgi:hypothetical protein
MNFIDHIRELTETNYVIQKLVDSKWMNSDVIIVNCAPRYSSRLTQLVNHKTSYLNKNQLYDQIDLDIPLEGENQVWCSDEKEYIPFDRYLANWVRKHSQFNNKYLFVSNCVFTGKHFNKIRLSIKDNVGLDNFKFLCLRLCSDSIIKPDFFYQMFTKDNSPIFFWENKNKTSTHENY